MSPRKVARRVPSRTNSAIAAALLVYSVPDLQDDLRAGGVQLVDAVEVDDHIADVFVQSIFDVGREALRGAEEDRSFELDHQDAVAVARQDIHRRGRARLARVHGIASIGHITDCSSEQEEQDADRQTERDRNNEICCDRHGGYQMSMRSALCLSAELASGALAHIASSSTAESRPPPARSDHHARHQ
jgi:hypothetical protein